MVLIRRERRFLESAFVIGTGITCSWNVRSRWRLGDADVTLRASVMPGTASRSTSQ